MINIQVTIINKLGLHARASAKFVSTAAKFQSQITVCTGTHSINGKSIMGVMMLAANFGSTLTLTIEGDDENEMTAELIALINNKFGEAE